MVDYIKNDGTKTWDEEMGAYVLGTREMTQEEREEHDAILAEALEQSKGAVRNLRTALLQQSDWINNADVSLSDEKKAEWVAYRQALRDITSHPNFPNLLPEDWPTEPS